MIKLKFVNIADSSDIIIIPFFKGYISNFNDADRNIKNDYNNKMTVYEKTYNMYEKMHLPSFDEVPTRGLDKTYEWVKNSLLKLKIHFERRTNDGIPNTNINCYGIRAMFNYNNKSNFSLYFDGNYPLDKYPLFYSVANPSWTSPHILCYDTINEVIFSMGIKSFTIEDAYKSSFTAKTTMANVSGHGTLPSKESNTVNTNGGAWYYKGSRITTNTSVDIFSDYGGIIECYMNSDHWIERDANGLCLYDIIKSEIKDYPDGDDDPDFPDGDGDDDSDDIDPNPIFPTSATGFVSLYAPTQAQLKELASFMWSKNFLDILLKLQQNPYDAIISIKNVCCNFDTGGTSNIILGNVDTGISSEEITQQYQQIDCGTINVTRYFGNFLDFNPYTSIKIYLPFVGYRELDVDEVMNASIHLYYNVDLLTGSCVASLQVTKNVSGTNLNSVLYQFDGMIATEIPVTANDYSQVISAIIKGAATTAAAIGVTAATGGAGAATGGALLGSAIAPSTKTLAVGGAMMLNSAVDTITSKINVQHGGSLSGSMGALSTKQPYLIITRVIPKNPTNYAKLHGIPSNAYKKLSSLKGFTKMQDIQIKSTIGSVDETEEIKQLLLGGVVI